MPKTPILPCVPVLASLALGCADGEAVGVAPPGPGNVVLGITSDVEVVEQMEALEVVLEVEGKEVAREVLDPGGGALFPFERQFPAIAPGTKVSAKLTPIADGAPMFERRVETSSVPDRTLLVRLRLNAECMPSDEWPRAATCTTSTCVAGLCEDPYVSPSSLEDYRPDWMVPFADPCVPDGSGVPVIELGHVDPPFTPLEPGTVLVPYWGEQGGTHVWFSVRMRNLHQVGTMTAITGDVLASGTLGSIQKFASPYEAGAAGCELYQLRYILPQNGAWEQDVRLGVTLVDATATCARDFIDVFIAAPD